MEYNFYKTRYNYCYDILNIIDTTNINILSDRIDYIIMDSSLVISYGKSNGITIIDYKDNIDNIYINNKVLHDILEEYRYFGDRIVY